MEEIKANLEKSLKSWEPFLNSVELCLLEEDWDLIREIQIPIEESIKKIESILKKEKENADF